VPQKPLGHFLNASGGVGAGVNCPSTTPHFFSAVGEQFFLGETEKFFSCLHTNISFYKQHKLKRGHV